MNCFISLSTLGHFLDIRIFRKIRSYSILFLGGWSNKSLQTVIWILINWLCWNKMTGHSNLVNFAQFCRKQHITLNRDEEQLDHWRKPTVFLPSEVNIPMWLKEKHRRHFLKDNMIFKRKGKKSSFSSAIQNRELLLETLVNLSLKLTSGALHICSLTKNQSIFVK